MISRSEACQGMNPTQIMNQSINIEEQDSLHSKTVSLKSKMKLPFKVSCMECVDNKVIVGSEQGGLYAYTISNGSFKMLFNCISAHKGSQVSQLHAQDNLPQTIFSCGFYERKVVSWNVTVSFMKNTESKVFKTFIYQLTSAQNKYILISTLKKIYALDSVTLAPMLKFTIQNYKSLDYLISSLGFLISSNNSSYLIAGTDNYKKSNFFLALWQVSNGNDDNNNEQQFVKKTRKLSNIDDLDNFDLDAECVDIETEVIEAVVPKISNPQLLEYSHSSRVFDIKIIPDIDRFVSLSYSELNIWAIDNNNSNSNNNNTNFQCQFSSSSSCGIQLVYSLRFGGEVNPLMNLRLSTVQTHSPLVLLFLDALMLIIDPSNPSFISQIPVTTTRNSLNNNLPKPASLSLIPCPTAGSKEYSSYILNHSNLGNNYAHANHFILRQHSNQISPPSQNLVFIRQFASKKQCLPCNSSKPTKTMNPREFLDILPTVIYPIQEEHSEMEEEQSKPHIDSRSLYYPYSAKPQSLHAAPSTAHIIPSAASVTILQNQLKRLEQSKTGKSLANIPAVCFARKNPSGQLRSNSKSIKKQLKRVVKFSNRRKKRANQNIIISKDMFLQQQQQQQYQQSQQQNHQQLSQFQPRRFNQSSLSPPRTKISKYSSNAQSSQIFNSSTSRKLSLSPRQVAISAVQNKQQQQQNTSQNQYNYNQFKQQASQTAQQTTQKQLGYSQLHTKPLHESPRIQPINKNNSNMCESNQQQTISKMMTMKQELPAIQLVALDSQLALGYWKFS